MIGSHYTDANGAMFKVASNGDKTFLPLPYASVFDVAADGGIWFVRNAVLSVATLAGAVTNLAQEHGATPAADGALGSSPLGTIALIAAGRDKVYLLIEEGTVTAPQTSSLSRSLRVLSRAAQGGWSVQTVPLFDDLQVNDVISAMRVGPADELVLLLNQPFKQLVSQQTLWPGGVASVYAASASVRVLDATLRWTELGSMPFSMSVSPNHTHGYLTYSYSLDARDLSIAPNGKVWVGGAGALYSVDAANGWSVVASSSQHLTDEVGQQGPITMAAFANPVQLVADNAGLTFYDGKTCQIRRLQDSQLTTFSGPVLSPPNFADARIMGLNSAGDLLFGYGYGNASAGTYSFGQYMSLFGLAKVSLNDSLFAPAKLKSLASPVGVPVCSAGTSYWAGTPSCQGDAPDSSSGAWLGIGAAGPIARLGRSIYSGLHTGPGTVLSSTLNWPGILNGDAPSGPSGVHLDGNRLYLFGTMRIDPPVDPQPLGYHEIRLYQLDLASGTASPVAGKSIASSTFSGQKIDLSPVLPTLGAGPVFVQHRSNGEFWLCNGKELWILDTNGRLRRVAGLSSTGSGAVDGVGGAASFAVISSIRVLPDNRLLVVDQGAHAIRLVNDAGKVVTIVGRLNQPGRLTGPLPGGLDNPVDVFSVASDLYITTQTSRQLLRASNAL